MARPMYDQNGTIYIPDIPSISITSFVDNFKLMIRSQILKILGEDLNIPLSPIDIEPFMKPIPFGVYHENSMKSYRLPNCHITEQKHKTR